MIRSAREITEDFEDQILHPLAVRSRTSRGRTIEDPEDSLRTCYQRDRDRILHCKSFRRLAHKTQVFLSPEGDHYRTRITHTLEVAQIARTLARALRLNEDLTEAIALGHDLGHTPFGHAGEGILNRLLPGGFHHVLQSLRVVELLEREGRGLNLTLEVRAGIRQHSKGKGVILSQGDGIPAASLEGQVVRVADIIAYLNHDLDDALRAKILSAEDLPVEIVEKAGHSRTQRIAHMVQDVLDATHLDEEPKIRLTQQGEALLSDMRAFLYERVYDNPVVHDALVKAERILDQIWSYFVKERPEEFRGFHWPVGVPLDETLERAVADFIAGMTDRYALRLHEALFLPKQWPVL